MNVERRRTAHSEMASSSLSGAEQLSYRWCAFCLEIVCNSLRDDNQLA